MSIDNYLQETGALATLADIMAGFAISAVIQLLSTDKPGKLMTVTIVAFAGSTVMFVYSLLVFVLLFAAAAESNIVPPVKLDGYGNDALLIIFGAIDVFLGGIGLSGWLRSKATGIATTILAFFTICLTSIAIITVMSIFA